MGLLDTEFQIRYRRNPISTIHTRLKSQTSILEKMDRLGCLPTIENMETRLNDIAGVRVICSYVDDIYEIAEALIRTIAMDFWASLEHQIKYKKDIPDGSLT